MRGSIHTPFDYQFMNMIRFGYASIKLLARFYCPGNILREMKFCLDRPATRSIEYTNQGCQDGF